jgi:hypothetical protein
MALLNHSYGCPLSPKAWSKGVLIEGSSTHDFGWGSQAGGTGRWSVVLNNILDETMALSQYSRLSEFYIIIWKLAFCPKSLPNYWTKLNFKDVFILISLILFSHKMAMLMRLGLPYFQPPTRLVGHHHPQYMQNTMLSQYANLLYIMNYYQICLLLHVLSLVLRPISSRIGY